MLPINSHSNVVSFTDRAGKNMYAEKIYAVWEKWEKEAQPGTGEKREIAMARMKDCLERQTETLDLSGLNLRNLPDIFPPCKDLIICNNFLSELSGNLPSFLKKLNVSYCALKELPSTLPDGLTHLNCEHNPLERLPSVLPPFLEEFNASHCQLIELPENLPKKIIVFNVEFNPLSEPRSNPLVLSPVTEVVAGWFPSEQKNIAKKSMETVITISMNERNNLNYSFQRIPERYDQEINSFELEKIACNIILKSLDSNSLSMINAFKENNHSPYLLIKNFISMSETPLTPVNDTFPDKKEWRLPAAALLGLLKLTGYSARSFQDEMNGRLCHMVMPTKNDDKSYLRSTKKLNFHTEVVNGHFIEDVPHLGSPVSPEVFGLIALRNRDNVPTTILRLEHVLDELDNETIAELMEHNYRAYSQSSFDREICINRIPVLYKFNEVKFGIRYSHSKLKANGENAEKALGKLRTVINNSSKIDCVVINPGDVLILNNRVCLHGRGSISESAKFDGFDRWLIRIYGYKKSTLPFLKTNSDNQHIMLVD